MIGFFRPTRKPRGPDPHLTHKMLIFAAGAGFALAGILSHRGWLVNVGIGVLALGLVLRIMDSRRS